LDILSVQVILYLLIDVIILNIFKLLLVTLIFIMLRHPFIV